MIDEIFEMVMKEARSRPGDDLNIKALDVLLELNERIAKAWISERRSSLDVNFIDDKTS